MTYKVGYVEIDRWDKAVYRTVTVDAPNKEQALKKVKSMRKRGCYMRDITVKEIPTDDNIFDYKDEVATCEICGGRLNDGGTCPHCDDGDFEYDDDPVTDMFIA